MASDIPITGNGMPRGSAKTITFKSSKAGGGHIDFEAESDDEPLMMIVIPGNGSPSRPAIIQLGENWRMEIRRV
jgi:hypothetical protein